MSHNQKCSGYWKLNTSYLDNVEYVDGIKNIIQNIKTNVDGSHISRWETMKYNVKQFSLNFAKKFQKNIKQKMLYLEQEITNIEESPSENIDMLRKRDLEKELSDLCDEKFKGVHIRSRARWIEKGEKKFKIFFKS